MKLKCYRALICGDRNWSDRAAIEREIKRLVRKYGTDGLIIIHGGAPGADQLAGVVARDLNVHVAEVKPLWDHRHASAGPQRNTAMLALLPHEVIGFHPDLAKSRGTKDMVKQAKAAPFVNVVKVVSH